MSRSSSGSPHVIELLISGAVAAISLGVGVVIWSLMREAGRSEPTEDDERLIQHFEEWQALNVVEREQRKQRMNEQERKNLKRGEVLYYETKQDE